MKKVVGLGACVLDTLINCEKYPVEDTKQRAESIFISGGGPVGNALVVLSKLGVKTEVLGALADDDAGRYLLEDFKKYGVGTNCVQIVKNSSSFVSYIVLSEQNKTRTCLFHRGSVPDDPSMLSYEGLKDACVLHLDGNYLNCALSAVEYAKKQGVKISLDAGGLYENIERLLPYVDILIPSAEFAMGITGTKSILQAMRILSEKYSPEILVVTDGNNGGYYLERREILHYDSIKVNAVDTNGAGDTFHGAFLAAYCQGKAVAESCRYASIVAGYKCQFKGARTYPLNIEIADKLFKK